MKLFEQLIQELIFRLKIVYYNYKKPSIQRRVFAKTKIKIVFFVLYDNMWKSDGLYLKLKQSERFDPCIISSPYPRHPRKFSQENQSRLENFFKKKGFTFYRGYDFDNNKWFDIKAYKPDIVFYQQPYNSGYAGFKIEKLWKNCLFGYVPYTYELEDNPAMLHHLLLNIAWRVFLPSSFEVKTEGRHLLNHGKNLVAVGSPLFDSLVIPMTLEDKKLWKIQNDSLKRLIWAPHHSILETDLLNYSNFLEIAQDMLELANRYKGQIQIAFKPHPVLKRKLYKLDGWGVNKTDAYYDNWANSENTVLIEGDYAGLFRSSDGMIHDCSTFTAEYLFTQKPVLYISKHDQHDYFNEFGKKCYDQHYLGNDINDIDFFIHNVILDGNDTMKEGRKQFFDDYLVTPNDSNVAQNMFAEFESALLPSK